MTLVAAACARPIAAVAQEAPQLPTDPFAVSAVVVTGRGADLTGIAASANQGVVDAKDLSLRPLLRPAEVVEQIPGVIITQHSGSGKANQYFLRGFNLDHGTDLAISLDGVPVNMVSHAHGQGYADLNYLIPELVQRVEYKKGPYYADVGDFGSAGAFDIRSYRALDAGLLKLEGGQTGFGRGVIANSLSLGTGSLLYGLELEHNDGPWDQGDDERKASGLLKWSVGSAANGLALTAMAYANRWNSTDQVPQRAIDSGLISRFGEIDPSDGGKTGRYSVSGQWARTTETTRDRVNLYALYYTLDLFSNFTYFLNDPVHGDQIEQQDRRTVLGGDASRTWMHTLLGRRSETTVGLHMRHDDITNGLYASEGKQRLSTTTADDVNETSLSPNVENQTWWTPWLRTIAGLRGEAFWFDVDDRVAGGSVSKDAQLLSPKVNVILGPWLKTEFYLNYGQGFHSNDARGVVAGIDHATPLARSQGYEFGLRTTAIPHLRSELSVWLLDIASELVWAGDSGTNEPSGPTRRYGLEWANWWTPKPWLTVDADYAWSHSRFTDDEPEGNRVPESLVSTFDGGVALHNLPGRFSRWSAGLRLRYFGPRPLTQDGSVKSDSTALLYADIGYRLTPRISLGLTVFNLLDRDVSDIDYFYTSRVPGEPMAGIDDTHTHPSEPREVRVSLTTRW